MDSHAKEETKKREINMEIKYNTGEVKGVTKSKMEKKWGMG